MISDKCPKCSKVHEQGKYRRYRKLEKIVCSAPDIKCSCGIIARWFVPIVRVSQSV
jgi:hypothetical protein